MMKLKQFRISNFRSIDDTGWINCDDITALVGINEAGKSNVILALWKHNPVRDGQIDLLHDMPTKHYSEWRSKAREIVFSHTRYELDEECKNKINELTSLPFEDLEEVIVSRYFDGHYLVQFPGIEVAKIREKKSLLESLKESIDIFSKSDENIKNDPNDKIIQTCKELVICLNKDSLSENLVEKIKEFLALPVPRSTLKEHKQLWNSIVEQTNFYLDSYSLDSVLKEKIDKIVIENMPTYVYYSNYGNLDAQIYLPHAIKWLNGEKVEGIDNDAKVRTLKVLFEFVHLDPQEVLELGNDPNTTDSYGRSVQVPEKEIEKAMKRKEERTILLNSASSELTQKFRDWWKQGNYRFRFHADGKFFKIWVSDDKRSEEVELERRSTGLQWFLSFFLVFLVESKQTHKGAILLLDEAGFSLHPLAQKDLIAFFENLSKTNQLIYTTHSPFLVDVSNIDRAKVVYTDEKGLTKVSENLRASEDRTNEKSIYAVHAALGLTVSDVLLQGCQPIIVEGPSDQNYLNMIKLVLMKEGRFVPQQEIVFIPSGGVKGIRGVASLLCGKNDELPIVLLDSDASGRDYLKKLQSGLYTSCKERILQVSDFVGIENAEIEDLIPKELMQRYFNKLFNEVDDEDWDDAINSDSPLVPQIEKFAMKHNIALPEGWKVKLSKNVKQQITGSKGYSVKIKNETLEMWANLFKKFNSGVQK